MILGLTWKTYEEKLNELNLLSLEERCEGADRIQTFKIIYGFSDVKPATRFKNINHNRVTRMANDLLNLEIQNSRSSIRNNLFTFRVPRKWNSIPQEVKQSTTVKSSNETMINSDNIREMLIQDYQSKSIRTIISIIITLYGFLRIIQQ